jgi:5'-nucleotidase
VFRLTVLHSNDGESQLFNAGEGLGDFGGIAWFATLVQQLKQQGAQARDNVKTGVITLNSGDNFLASPEFNASLTRESGPYYDSIALDIIGFDAMAIGNHEFDFGPDILARFIDGFTKPPAFVSANLNMSKEPTLKALVDAGLIVPSTVATISGEQIGVVGATTPRLPHISSPRTVEVDSDVAKVVQAEVDRLINQGVNKIILISHLQTTQEDLALAPQLRGVDIMIAGGGTELLANPGTLLLPEDDKNIVGPYPRLVKDATGNKVLIVTTAGGYRYVGWLVVEFDTSGDIVRVDPSSGPVRVAGGSQPDAVADHPQVKEQVVVPVKAYIAGLSGRLIGTSEAALNGQRSVVRTRESNEGNLMADALLWQADQLASQFSFNSPEPMVGIQNGGGIRNNNIIPAGKVTMLDTFSMAPFANFVSIVPNIPPAQFMEIMENAISQVEDGSGRFSQISGFKMVYDPKGTAQVTDNNGVVTTPGNRIKEIVLNDGRAIVKDGQAVSGAPNVHVATIDFLARGGDQYPYRGAEYVTLGVTYQQEVANYIKEGLGGSITKARYPEGGEGRIRTVGTP